LSELLYLCFHTITIKLLLMSLLRILGGNPPALNVLIIVGSILFIALVLRYNRTIDTVTHLGYKPFEELQFSSQDFYKLVEALVVEKQMPGVSVKRVFHLMHGQFSGKREYIRVQYQRYFFDICAAPFAKDFFVSYRQGTLNVLIRKKREKTFYEIDTENMFHSSVLLCYDRAIDMMQEKKGKRLSTDAIPTTQYS
jgi:hypothetical protein